MNRINSIGCMLLWLACLASTSSYVQAQTAVVEGTVMANNYPVPFAHVIISSTTKGTLTDHEGRFQLSGIPLDSCVLRVSAIGYEQIEKTIRAKADERIVLHLMLSPTSSTLQEVVVSGTMQEVSKLDSPVPVEVYTVPFFKSNPTATVFDALQTINGIRPQLNCNICNTGDIHINGLEGPYTLVMIDGMPMVSGLGTVYGLSGIPQSLIERVEVVKGPASTLYGSEAVGGLINIITHKPTQVPRLSADSFITSWGELNADIASKVSIGKQIQSLLGINYFNYSLPFDKNKDGFTDVALQNRISLFNKWAMNRKEGRAFSVAMRYLYEDRWSGDTRWTKECRGTDAFYGESIYTNRWELFGTYALPTKEKIRFQFSGNGHYQNSVYGLTTFQANQFIGFSQLVWSKRHTYFDWLMGLTYRFIRYDDNTPATADAGTNKVSNTYLPGLFLQNDIHLHPQHNLLLGTRYDYHSIHGSIFTPRVNYKWNSYNKNNIIRLSVGNGYRVANIFTEDHAALTGARRVEFLEKLKPETSWNGNLNAVKKIGLRSGAYFGLDGSLFYTYFQNKIIPDYTADPNKILYKNLDGYAISKGMSINLDVATDSGWKLLIGATYMEVYRVENQHRIRQLFTEKFTGTWSIGYIFSRYGLSLDYTGNLYSPMQLPLLSATDPRQPHSPWWSIQNIQCTKKFSSGIELYGGIKNLLNWTPNRGNPFIIARAHDPFDKEVQFDANGQAMVTPNNPYGLTFDPTYIYAPNQGIRGFIGIRYTLAK